MGHHHHHDCDHQQISKNHRAFAIGISLNIIFVIAEALFGYLSSSLALLADAGHNFSDVIGLGLAWGAVWLSSKQPSREFTYGLRSSSILATFSNAVILL